MISAVAAGMTTVNITKPKSLNLANPIVALRAGTARKGKLSSLFSISSQLYLHSCFKLNPSPARPSPSPSKTKVVGSGTVTKVSNLEGEAVKTTMS